MNQNETLFHRYTSLMVVLGLLFFVTSCAAENAQGIMEIESTPTYTETTTFTTCMNNDENPRDCSEADTLLNDVPFQVVLNSGEVVNWTTQDNGQVTFKYPEVVSWELLLKEYEDKTGRCPKSWVPNENSSGINIIFELCGEVDA